MLVLIPFALQEVSGFETSHDISQYFRSTFDGYLIDSDNDDTCTATLSNITADTTSDKLRVGTEDTADTTDCYRGFFEFDISAIPSTAIITDVDLHFEHAINFGLFGCEVRQITIQPSTSVSTDVGLLALWNDLKTNNLYKSTFTDCQDDFSVTEINLIEPASIDDLQAQLSTGWFAISISTGLETPSAVDEWVNILTSNRTGQPVFFGEHPMLEVQYEDPHMTKTTLFAVADGLHGRIRDDGNNDLCDGNSLEEIASASTISTYNVTDSNDCARIWFEWDLSLLIPSAANIVNVDLKMDTNQDILGCDFILFEDQPSTLSALDLWNAYETNQTTLFNQGELLSNKGCTIGGDHQYPLGFNATAYALEHIASNGWFGLGIKHSNETLRTTGTIHTFIDEVPPPDIRIIIFHENGIPDPVTTLAAFVVGDTAIDLTWTVPNLFGGTLDGAQINFTTPFGDPITIITNNTNTTDNESTITGLASETDYSFRVGVWTEISGNASGNIANGTTADFGNFTVGFFDLEASDFDERDIKYTRVDLNSTHTNLEVVHPNAFTLSCDFYFKLAIKNQTYTSLPTVPEGANEKKATFQFHDIQNDIIEVRCTDVSTNVTAPYLLTQTDFELLTQFANFRSGAYGTAGQFGSVDLITLGAIIVAMIGFNRVNESVGAIFAVIILGVLSYFEIVVWQTFMFGTVAVVLMLVIASTRKN